MEVTESKNLNAAAEQIVKELSSHNIRISELDQAIEMVKEKISKQPLADIKSCETIAVTMAVVKKSLEIEMDIFSTRLNQIPFE